MFNFDRAFFGGQTTRLISSAKRSLQDRQRDVYDSHRHRVFALAYYMFGNEVQSEETLQHTFVRAFNSVEEPNAQIIDSALMVELRSQITFDDPLPHVEASTQASVVTGNIRRTDLEEAIWELPPMERLIFLLKDVEGYTIEAISGFTKVPSTELPRILMSARLRLRAALATAAASKASKIIACNVPAVARNVATKAIDDPPSTAEAA